MSHAVDQKKKLLLRARRIQGQVEAVVRTLDEERECLEVLQVMSAARGAMNSLMAELLEGHIRNHLLNGKHKLTSQQVSAADEVDRHCRVLFKASQFRSESGESR